MKLAPAKPARLEAEERRALRATLLRISVEDMIAECGGKVVDRLIV